MFVYFDQGHVRVDWYYFLKTKVFVNTEKEVRVGFSDNYQDNKRFGDKKNMAR